MTNVELASAYVSIVPSTRGFVDKLNTELGGSPMKQAGETAGDVAGAGFASKFTGAVKGGAVVAGAGLTAAIGGLGLAAKLGGQFDDAFDTIRVGTGATGEDLAALQDDFRAVFGSVPTEMGPAAAAIADLNTRLGVTGEPLQTLSEQFLELSRITDTDLGQNIETVTRVFGDWGVETENQSAKLDALFRASQATGPSVDRLSQLMVQFGSPLRQLGFDFDQTAAILGKFEQEGVNTELVMGSMRQALGRMARDGEPAQETLQRVTEEIANAGSVSEANALALELFGARAGPDMAAAIREGRFEVGELLDTVANGEETITGAADDTADFAEKFQTLKNKALLGLEPIATKVFDALGRGIDIVMGLAATFQQSGISGVFAELGRMWSEAWPGIQSTLSTLAGNILSWLGEQVPILAEKLVGWAGAFVEWILPQIPPMLEKLGQLLGSVAEWLIDEGLPLLVEKLTEWGSAFVAWVGPQIPPLLLELGKLLLRVGDWIITDALPKLIGKLGEWAAAFIGWVASDAIPGLISALGDLHGALSRWFVEDAIPMAIEKTGDLINGILGWFTGLPELIGELASGMFDGIWEAFKGAINLVIDAWNGLEFEIPGFDPPGPGPTFGGFTLGMPDIPRLHSGGRVPGGPGDEYLYLLEGGETVRTREQEAALGAGPGIVINANGLTAEEAVQYVPAAIRHVLVTTVP